MLNMSTFHLDVIAYPAVLVIGRKKTCTPRVALRPEISMKAFEIAH